MHRCRGGTLLLLVCVLIGMAGSARFLAAQGPEMVGGSPILTVLPVDAIPAIDDPRYVTVAEADRWMRPEEQVLGIRDGQVAKAYSTWQLNHHEIVNTTLGKVPVAVTW